MHDIVIRQALIVDGSGEQARQGDVAIRGDCIVAVGGNLGLGRRDRREANPGGHMFGVAPSHPMDSHRIYLPERVASRPEKPSKTNRIHR